MRVAVKLKIYMSKLLRMLHRKENEEHGREVKKTRKYDGKT